MIDLSDIIYKIAYMVPGFLLAIVAHEFSHAYVAYRFGDDTAQRSGRMTLNPAAHYDFMGTIVFPLIGVIAGFAAIGWAKPVPIDSRNFKKNHKSALFWVSFAGPLSNLMIGMLSSFLFAVVVTQVSPDFSFKNELMMMLRYSILINFILAAFNLIPLPPLDGSRMVSSMLSYNAQRKYDDLAQYTPMIFLGAMVLSFMGVPTFHYLMVPITELGEWITQVFLLIFS
jgi:Zn-dependent protease